MMDDLEVCRSAGPPATIEDLSKFLLIAPEKAAAMRAEIRAIKKAGLAAEVYEQKLREQRILAEMILDASVLMGEMAKEIRKGSGGDRRSESFKSNCAVTFEKGSISGPSKSEAIQELGFSKQQIHNFEVLAANKDLVEREKAQAREEDRMPTRTRVIDLAQKRKEYYERDMAQIEEDGKWAKAFVKAVHAPFTIADHLDRVAAAVWRNSEGNVSRDIAEIDMAIQMLGTIKAKLMEGGRLYGKAPDYFQGSAKVHHQ